MKHTRRTYSCAILAVLFAFMAFFDKGLIVLAANGSAYTASVTANYQNPSTGEIEDPGNNVELGQSMVSSVVGSTALIEKEESGDVYATARIFMMDNISSVRFFTQQSEGTEWSEPQAVKMQDNAGGDNSSDYRFLVPDENTVVKASLYVTPMGRDVIFFFQFSGLQEGNGDFVVSVTQSEEINEVMPVEEESVSEVPNVGESNTEQTTESVAASDTIKPDAKQLIENTKGLTLSDDSLLGESSLEEVMETETVNGKEINTIAPLPWELVWQCILIMTLPALIIGVVLGVLKIVIIRNEGRQ